MKTRFAQFVMQSEQRLAMPIGVYAGLEMTGATVRQAVSDADVQFKAVMALHKQFHTPFLLTAMDLSAEAEAFGCTIRMSDEEIPTVIGRLVTDAAGIAALPHPKPGDMRTAVHLETARQLVQAEPDAMVFGGLIGPFSLAGRLFGVSEALELSLTDPDTLHSLLEHVTEFITAYALAFRQSGAAGIIMAEPAAGLLSPGGLGKFSSAYVRRIIEAVQTDDFTVILHNCGAKLVHLNRVLESGAEVLHFGQPMDLPAALAQVQGKVVLCGNLDPSAVFHAGTPQSISEKTSELLQAIGAQRNYVASSGCDLPPGTPLANLTAFYQAVLG